LVRKQLSLRKELFSPKDDIHRNAALYRELSGLAIGHQIPQDSHRDARWNTTGWSSGPYSQTGVDMALT
jgi:hypothetical protein